MIFSILIICILLVLYLLLGKKRRKVENEPPIEYGWIPWIGCGLSYRRDGYSFLRKMEKKHGPIFTLFMGGHYYTVVTDPLAYGQIVKEAKRLNFRELSSALTERIFGYKQVSSDTPLYGSLYPIYLQGERLKDMIISTRTNMEHVVSTSKYWNCTTSYTVDVFEFTYEIVFEAGFKTLFGSYQTDEKSKLAAALKHFLSFDHNFVAVTMGTPFSANKNFLDTRKKLWKIVGEQNLRLNSCEMIEVRNKFIRNQGASQLRINQEALTVLWAAQANTAPSCFWALYFLLRDQEARRAVTEEIALIVKKKGYDTERQLGKDDFQEMTIMGSVIKEALRLSIATVSARSVQENMSVFIPIMNASYKIRKGEKLLLPFRLLHMNSEVYDDPHTFRYDRYINSDGKEKKEFTIRGKKLHYYLQPFGTGESICPGRFWAISQIKQFLISVLTTFEMELVDCDLPVQMSKHRFAFGTLHPSVRTLVKLKIKKNSHK